MMTDEQRRYGHARRDFKNFHVDKAQELINAADAAVDAAERNVKQIQQAMDELRPIWAQGFSSDSHAAQANGTALAEIWAELGVDNQTGAMSKLRAWPGRLEAAFLEGHRWGRSNEPITHSAGENWERSETRKRLHP